MADLTKDEVLRRIRSKQSLKRAGLAGIDLTGANLEGVDFSRADFEGGYTFEDAFRKPFLPQSKQPVRTPEAKA